MAMKGAALLAFPERYVCGAASVLKVCANAALPSRMCVPMAENKKMTGFVVLWQSDELGFTLARLHEVVAKFLIIVIAIVLAILVEKLITSGLSCPESVILNIKIFIFESLKIVLASSAVVIVFYVVACWVQRRPIPAVRRELTYEATAEGLAISNAAGLSVVSHGLWHDVFGRPAGF
jgi:hypothetical protein